MALVKRRTSSNRTIIIAVVVLVLGGIGWFLVQQFLAPTSNDMLVNQNRNRTVITNFGETILNDARYQDLQSFDQTVTVNVNADSGNPNPFQ